MTKYGIKKTVPGAPFVTLEEQKKHCHIDLDDDDTVVTDCFTAAQSHCEALTAISFTESTWELTLDSFCETIQLPRGPVVSVDSITYIDSNGDEKTLEPGAYRVDKSTGRIRAAAGSSWPISRGDIGGVKVTFKAGDVAQTEPMLKLIVKQLAATFYEHREFIVSGANIQELPVPVRFNSLLQAYADPSFGG